MQNIAKVGKGYVLFMSRLKQPLIPRAAAGGLTYRHAYQQGAGAIAVTFQSSSFLTYLINSITT